MKNLIIHPTDRSTDFLKPIYEKVAEKQVISNQSTPEQILELITESNRVMMMGHGSPGGLFSMRLFEKFVPYIVKADDSGILKAQTENVYIWCHANKYVENNDLKGFYSGMFVSEVGEAMFCGVKNPNQQMVNESNDTFASILGDCIDLPKEDIYEKVIREYGELAKHNPVADYNLQRLYVR